jgi:hypothetical protein
VDVTGEFEMLVERGVVEVCVEEDNVDSVAGVGVVVYKVQS